MFVKISPIKADDPEKGGETCGWQKVRSTQKYIEAKEKVIVPEEDLKYYGFRDDSTAVNDFYYYTEKDFHRVIDYIVAEDRVEAKYVSKYMCWSDDVALDFQLTAAQIAFASRGRTKPDTGALAYHIVQSFPVDLDISNEEIHHCGIELVKRLEKYQALICSHVHPVFDKDSIEHGGAKHNHILINAFMYPDFYDPKKGGPRKYHDCNETYRQLQIYNDEIALEHGLPIIQNPDHKRSRSWKEANEKKKGTSWKERVRVDIEKYSRAAKSWDEFVRIMKLEGYDVKEKTYVTYTTPDGYKVRDCTLGKQFLKETLELYWQAHNI